MQPSIYLNLTTTKILSHILPIYANDANSASIGGTLVEESAMSTGLREVLVEPLLITAREVAGLTQKSVRSIWRDNAAKRLPRPLRLGGSVRWRRDEILEWVAGGCPGRAEWEARKDHV
jgi:predicted DNA-binding transcriptional regulator AlpA